MHMELKLEHTHHIKKVVKQQPIKQPIKQDEKVIEERKQQKKEITFWQQEQKPIKKVKKRQSINKSELIVSQLRSSIKSISSLQQTIIMNKMGVIENLVYYGCLQQNSNYLETVFEDKTPDLIRQGISDLMNSIGGGISQDIFNGSYKIAKKKQRLGQSGKIYDMQRQLQSRIVQMKLEMSFQSNSNFGNNDGSIEQIKNKQAKKFVQQMKKQKQRQIKLKQQRYSKLYNQEQQKIFERKQIQEQIIQERNLQIKKRIEEREKIQKQEIEKRIKQKQMFKQFIIQFKKKTPLFKKIQNRFKKNVLQEQDKRREQILTSIKQAKRSINKEQIQDHTQWYQDIKNKNKIIKMQEVKEQKEDEEQRLSINKEYYRGKAHSMIEKQSIIKEDQSLKFRTQLRKKKQEYASLINQKFKPKPSQIKKKQLQQIAEKGKWVERLRSKSYQAKAHEDGLKNLQKIRDIVKSIKEKKLNSSVETKNFSTISTKPIYKNYLDQLRSRRLQTSRYQTSNYENMAAVNTEWTQIQAKRLEEKARRRQKYLKNARTLDIDSHMKEHSNIQENYLESARAKLAILNQFY